MKFNEKLVKLRKAKGMSQEELGYELNVTRQTISKWELGDSTPEMEKLIQISNYFGISVDELISNNEDTTGKNTNKEFVGVDQKYIPNDVKSTTSYVNKDKNSYKILLIPIIAIVLPIIIAIVVFVVIVPKQFSPMKMMDYFFDKSTNIMDKYMEKSTDVMDKYIEKNTSIVENSVNNVENTKNSVNQENENLINQENKYLEYIDKNMEQINSIQGDMYEQYNKAKEKYNKTEENFTKQSSEMRENYNKLKNQITTNNF